MIGKRLKAIGTWGVLLFVVSNAAAFILVAALGQVTGLLLTIPVAVVFAGFAGYKAASTLAGNPGYEKKNQLTIAGASVAFVSALLSAALNYFMTGQINFSAGLFTIVAAAIGGYMVERKRGGATFFGK